MDKSVDESEKRKLGLVVNPIARIVWRIEHKESSRSEIQKKALEVCAVLQSLDPGCSSTGSCVEQDQSEEGRLCAA
ncbi:MAG: hypothetical protein JSV20_04015 [Candidatus Bathyarchaeota archaeon]|nr:MAG: hypothetical protein JSV20_04015 [Candidatus Bathyarchaeota archaeon]